MKNILLVKREENQNAIVPHNIPVNTEYYGWISKEPTIGSPFFVNLDKWGRRYFRTSPVTEIIDEHKFRTWNSVYEIVEVEDRDDNQ